MKTEQEATDREERAARFGILTVKATQDKAQKDKMKQRAERFGTYNVTTTQPELIVEKRKERAKRFGVVTKETLVELRQERMERFKAPGGIEPSEIQARAKRFNSDPALEDSKQKRQQRFAQ